MLAPINNFHSNESFKAIKITNKPKLRMHQPNTLVTTKESKLVQKTSNSWDRFWEKWDKINWETFDLVSGLIGVTAMLAGIITLIVKIATPIVKFFRYFDAM